MVSVGTFDWHSVRPSTLRRMPHSENIVMLVTVVVTVATHNLAYGVIAGVNVAFVVFARRVAHFANVERVEKADTTDDGVVDTVTYTVSGELFFASSNDLVYQFDYAGDPDDIVIDLSGSHVWDASTVAALDAVETKYAAKGKRVRIVGLNTASQQRLSRLSGHLGGGS